MKPRLAKIFCLMATALLYGCVSHFPRDLSLNSVLLVKEDRLYEVTGDKSKNKLVNGDYIVLEVSTKEDMVFYALDNSSTLSARVHFCQNEEVPVYIYPVVYSEGKDIFRWEFEKYHSSDELEKNLKKKNQLHFNYQIVIPMKFQKDLEIYGRPNRPEAVFYAKYDLRKLQQDICVQMVGGGKLRGFRSNLVEVESTAIAVSIENESGL